jgi:hypothetical protein
VDEDEDEAAEGIEAAAGALSGDELVSALKKPAPAAARRRRS